MGMTTLRRFLIKHDIQHNASLFEKLIESPMGKKKQQNTYVTFASLMTHCGIQR